jgi:hypothetical protein
MWMLSFAVFSNIILEVFRSEVQRSSAKKCRSLPLGGAEVLLQEVQRCVRCQPHGRRIFVLSFFGGESFCFGALEHERTVAEITRLPPTTVDHHDTWKPSINRTHSIFFRGGAFRALYFCALRFRDCPLKHTAAHASKPIQHSQIKLLSSCFGNLCRKFIKISYLVFAC